MSIKTSRIIGFLTGLLFIGAIVYAGATFSRITTWSSGQTLTASALNAEFNNILNNFTPAGMDDYSATTTEMRALSDPYPGSVESQATALAGEIERIRYQILEIKKAMQPSNVTYWYQDLPTAGVFSVVSSSVGINDTTPSYAIDVTGTGHFTGNVTIDGTLTAAGNDAASVKRSGGGAQSILATTITKIQFNSETFDTASAFDSATNYTYTAPLTAKYRVHACVGDQPQIGDDLTIYIYVNGASVRSLRKDAASGSFETTCITDLLSLTASDTIDIRFQNAARVDVADQEFTYAIFQRTM